MVEGSVAKAEAGVEVTGAAAVGRKLSRVDIVGSRLAFGAGAGLLLVMLVVLLAPVLPIADPEQVSVLDRNSSPSRAHPLGTDEVGRDVLSRLMFGGRVSLLIGIGVAVVSTVVGTALGALAGYLGGWMDSVVMGLTNLLQSFPLMVLVMVVGSIVSLTPSALVGVIAAVSWVTTARLVRGQVLSLREQQFVEAARCLGASTSRIVARHLVPNVLGPVLVSATLLVAFAILTESALSFLGFGVRPPTPTWGNMLNAAQAHIRDAPWLGIFPGVAISLTVLGFNIVGETLQERLDPRLRGR